jgi:trans-aconitate 2-methyltransferase
MPEAMNTGPREWDAETYDEVSDPQFSWGMEVLGRTEMRPDESVLDAGCGSGRVTAELRKRIPDGRLVAVDGSEQMIAKARESLGDGVEYVVADLSELRIDDPVDLVFSTATFHWISDHDRLFARIRGALRPGGRLIAQCGGRGNVASHARAIVEAAADPRFASHFSEMTPMWNFAGPEETEARLADAGFTGARCWLEVHDDRDAGAAPCPAPGEGPQTVRGSRARRVGSAAGPRLRAPQHRRDRGVSGR